MMEVNRRVSRFILWLLCGFLISVDALCFLLTDWQNWWNPILLLLFPVLGSTLAVFLLYCYPKVLLQQDGIYVKWWFRTRHIPWSEICQVGVSCFYPRGFFINSLVLVRSGCSKRGFRDSFFHLRNLGKLIYLPYTPKTKAFILSRYGPLDFNLSDCKAEGSTVEGESAIN